MEKYTIADFCLIRVPAFPKRYLTKVNDFGARGVPDDGAVLRDIFGEEGISAALHSGTSPEFYSEYRKWMNGSKLSRDNEKIQETLLLYLTRMTFNCVPFGLYSGFSLAHLGERTTFQLGDTKDNVAHQRLDMDYIQGICDKLKVDEKIMNAVRYFPNTSMYKTGEMMKYVEFTIDKHFRKYHFSAVESDDYLGLILAAAVEGATIGEMTFVLVQYDGEVDRDEAVEYIRHLIDNQILVSELEPTVTGKDNLIRLMELLEAVDARGEELGLLREASALLQEKRYSIGNAEKIRTVIEQISGLATNPYILQTDLEVSTVGAVVSRRVIETITSQVQSLSIFAHGVDRPALRKFTEDFLERYEMREIPLVEALDPDIGIGYGGVENSRNDLIETIQAGRVNPADALLARPNGLTEFMVKKYVECIRNGSSTIVLSDPELDKLREMGLDRKLPENFFIFGSILSFSLDELDADQFKFHLKQISGPPSCCTMGRFCYTSPEFTEHLRSWSTLEETLKPEAIYAELVHLPDARVGNVLIRPHLRKYEIEYLGRSGLDTDHKIPVTDIMVSVRNNKVRLRSKKFNREIIPRLTTAHVFSDSRIPIYKFLGELQRSAGGDAISWEWAYLAWQRFLPRVEYKNIVLKPARWMIRKKDFETIDLRKSMEDARGRLRAFADCQAIPKMLVFVDKKEREFLIDLRNDVCCDMVLRELNQYGEVQVEEYMQDDMNCWVRDIHGDQYANEIMFPVIRLPAEGENSGKQPFIGDSIPVARKFPIGSEWVYFKLYTSKQGAEKILIGGMQALVQQLKDDGWISCWHFVRYADPDYHVRIRFRAGPKSGAYQTINEKTLEVFKRWCDQKLLYKVQMDTYSREVERYGSHTIMESEEIFSIDSDACLAFINMARDYIDQQGRWLWALKAIDMSLGAFGYSSEAKQRVAAKLEQYLKNALPGSESTFTSIHSKYEIHADLIGTLLDTDKAYTVLPDLLRDSMYILGDRQAALLSVGSAIRRKLRSSGEKDLDDLMSSYIHMFVNRLFASDQNKCELILYSMLNRHYVANSHKNSEFGRRGMRQSSS
ncbi:MAG TPA: lantibiotic dehydratase [Puia sp.]|nr:lantibiotic dehydratase [Puia sp.]